MKNIFILIFFVFSVIFFSEKVNAFCDIPYNSYSYRTYYPNHYSHYYPNYHGYNYGYGYYPNNYNYNKRRHPIKDKREIKYLKEYYSAINGNSDSKGQTYQNGNKTVNVNISMWQKLC